MALRKALVMSVGTGTRTDVDITRPLVKSVRRSNPSFILWLVSPQSHPHAERMAVDLRLERGDYEIWPLTTIDNIETIYRECRAAFRVLDRKGFPSQCIEVDFTSGTKAMTAGLTLAAVACRCQYLTYVTGDYQHGVVMDDTERPVQIEPRRVWADERLALATAYCHALRFDSALDLLHDVLPRWLGPHESQALEGFQAVARGYGAWDRFDYARAKGELDKLRENDAPELRSFKPDHEVLRRVIGLKLPHVINADRLADLFNNASRRLDEGRYDDALARFYRLAEMLGQWALFEQHGINASDVSLARIPEATGLRPLLDARRNQEGKIQIGLEMGYRLLEALGHPLGTAFVQDSSVAALLWKRNHSLLAHGFDPIEKKDVESLARKLNALANLKVSDWDERKRTLEFPWRKRAG